MDRDNYTISYQHTLSINVLILICWYVGSVRVVQWPAEHGPEVTLAVYVGVRAVLL